VCDGSGGVSSIADDNDVPTEGGECTSATCVAGVPSYIPLQLDAPCTENGGVVCDGNGTCVQCNVAAQCPAGPVCTVAACRAGACHQEQVAAGTPCSSGGTVCDGSGACVPCLSASDCPPSGSECEVSTCTANACGTTSQPYGLPLSLQTEGDCRTEICDGTGGVTSAPDDNDIPSGGSQCSSATCMNGTPAYFPNPAGSACDENGGRVCDGSGSCVSCNVAADCPAGPDECSIAVCSSNACSLNNAPVGVPCGNGGTCDGAGNCL
jgi:hypothetical protein